MEVDKAFQGAICIYSLDSTDVSCAQVFGPVMCKAMAM